ncbi:N-acyl-phosphatidylethanolamine-hydrolyzing phospholipase D-like [Ylistrum balloti]|uniref:N-acyl-phosphatidylethanolamine-hydrolyzing phospholipase D-like n=1 Tax=Ylistrum balloti TaxID=509963 RepID=UPI002905E0A5|nr:N-acyl-phosphatidylethanolamine-hydrolyzing phospholipase D-like [Ylistrum balloti]
MAAIDVKDSNILQSTRTKPVYANGVYNNPWTTWVEPSFCKVLYRMLVKEKDHSKIPSEKQELDKHLPVQKPDFDQLMNPPKSGVQATWIGHASVLVQLDGITVITDPIFSERCSMFQWIGPKRYRPPPFKIDELPVLDAVVISHNHYDHLDHGSVVSLNKKFGDELWWYVPMGTRRWMLDCGCKNVVELSWWEEHRHSPDQNITFCLTPSQHWCKRTATDTNKALWGSWVIKGPNHRFFFAGDTGYCEAFKQIGEEYGPFDLSAIPIGAYAPRYVMKSQHVDPEEAVLIHQDVKSSNSLGIHWGTFKLTYEFYLEPKTKLAEELKKSDLSDDCFVTLNHGETRIFRK